MEGQPSTSKRPSAVGGIVIVGFVVAILFATAWFFVSLAQHQFDDTLEKARIMQRGALIDAERERQYRELHEKEPGLYPR